MEEHRDAAREAVRTELARRKWEPAQLAREAELDSGTVSDFLNGKRWPRTGNLAKIDEALGWPAGTLDTTNRTGRAPEALAEARPPQGQSVVEEVFEHLTDRIMLSVSRSSVLDLEPSELEEAAAAATTAYLAKVREIRAHRARLAAEGVGTHELFPDWDPPGQRGFGLAARAGEPVNRPDSTTGEESQDTGGDGGA